MRRPLLLGCLFLLVPLFSVFARDNIVFYQTGEQDPALWNGLKKYFTNKGYGALVYGGATGIEQQIQIANKINREKASVFLALELVPSEKESLFVAVSQATRGKGKILEIDELPAAHGSDSEELALSIAAPFGVKVKRFPVFAFLGIDMPTVFLRVDCPKDRTGETFNKLNEGLQKYFNRGAKDEDERKSQ